MEELVSAGVIWIEGMCPGEERATARAVVLESETCQLDEHFGLLGSVADLPINFGGALILGIRGKLIFERVIISPRQKAM